MLEAVSKVCWQISPEREPYKGRLLAPTKPPDKRFRHGHTLAHSTSPPDHTAPAGYTSHRHRLHQSSNPAQDRREQVARERHLGHLEAGVAGMPDHLGADLDQSGLQGSQ